MPGGMSAVGKMPNQHRPWSMDDRLELDRLWLTGLTIAQIGTRLNRSGKSISERARLDNLPLRKAPNGIGGERVSSTISRDFYDRLCFIARRDGVRLAEIMRRALTAYLT